MADTQRFDFLVTAEDTPRDRLDRYLVARIPGLSRSELARRLVRAEVNGKAAKHGQALHPGDQVQLELAAAPESPAASGLLPELELLHEDDDVLVLRKPEGVLVHGGAGVREATLADAVRAKLRGELAHFADPARPGVVHRLDRETSGLMVFARTPRAEKKLLKAFQRREVEKRYRALVKGVLYQAEGVYDKPIGPDPARALHRSVKPDLEHGDAKEALTAWSVAERYAAHTLMEIDLHTGRTHQIRVHFQNAGHPVVGDRRYDRNAGPEDHLFLCAVSLAFSHPVTGEPLSFETPLPPWFEARLVLLRGLR